MVCTSSVEALATAMPIPTGLVTREALESRSIDERCTRVFDIVL